MTDFKEKFQSQETEQLTQFGNIKEELHKYQEELEELKNQIVNNVKEDDNKQSQLLLQKSDTSIEGSKEHISLKVYSSMKEASSNKIEPSQEKLSQKQNIIYEREELSPLSHLKNKPDNIAKTSLEIAKSEQSEDNMPSLNGELTKSSKPSTWDTNRINTKIGNIVGSYLKELQHKLVQLTNKVESLRFSSRENTREIDFNRHKIFTLIKTQKGNFGSKEKITESIKKGIKHAKKSPHNEESYFHRFQHAHGVTKKNNRSSTFIENLTPKLVNWVCYYLEKWDENESVHLKRR